MDRWYWGSSALDGREIYRHSASGIRLYDGDKRTSFDDGRLTLTSLRLIWHHASQNSALNLNLELTILVEEESGGFASSPKIVLHLASAPPYQPSGPFSSSTFTLMKLSFRHGGISDFMNILNAVLKEKAWDQQTMMPIAPGLNTKQFRAGILGIERNLQAKQQEATQNINHAFEDLKNLMGLAKDMVTLSKNIANKIKERTGEISSDETIQLRSYLLSLGIDDPVTKEAVGSTTEYHRLLAKEICSLLEPSVREVGGVMLLSEVYCRINRARGLQLLSPEDVHNGCSLMLSLGLPLCLHTFQSGVKVLQLTSLDVKKVAEKIKNILQDHEKQGISAAEFARLSGVPLLLAQERLHDAERCAAAVRDESAEGLRFFPNLFFSRA